EVWMRVAARELERPERQLTQLLKSFGDRHAFAAHPLEQRLQTLGIHDAFASHYNMDERVGTPRPKVKRSKRMNVRLRQSVPDARDQRLQRERFAHQLAGARPTPAPPGPRQHTRTC